MKQLHLLVWITQLGLSTAIPLCGFLFLSLWLRNRFGWGDWVVAVGIVLGFISAIDSFRIAMGAMQGAKKKKEEPPVAFNEHD